MWVSFLSQAPSSKVWTLAPQPMRSFVPQNRQVRPGRLCIQECVSTVVNAVRLAHTLLVESGFARLRPNLVSNNLCAKRLCNRYNRLYCSGAPSLYWMCIHVISAKSSFENSDSSARILRILCLAWVSVIAICIIISGLAEHWIQRTPTFIPTAGRPASAPAACAGRPSQPSPRGGRSKTETARSARKRPGAVSTPERGVARRALR